MAPNTTIFWAETPYDALKSPFLIASRWGLFAPMIGESPLLRCSSPCATLPSSRSRISHPRALPLLLRWLLVLFIFCLVGKFFVFIGVVVMGGFAVLFWSQFPPHVKLGYFVAAYMVVCCVMALIVLPLLFFYYRPRMPDGKPTHE